MPIVLTSGPWCSDRGAVFGLQVVGWVGMSGYGGGGHEGVRRDICFANTR